MFCQKCGQQQVSESAHFCSRCGFELNSFEEGLGKRLFKMAMTLILIVCAIMGWGSITSGPGYMQVRIIITLIAAVAFYLLFSRDLKHIFDRLFSHNPAIPKFALPPTQRVATPSLESHRVNTAEIIPPPSITEQTTILIGKNRQRPAPDRE